MTLTPHKKLQFGIAILLIIIAWWLLEQRPPSERDKPPSGLQASVFDYSETSDVREKKQLFFDILRPIVQQENQRLQDLRDRLLALEPEERNDSWVLAVADRFGIDGELDRRNWAELIRRVDIIPLELALAQAAMESAWGESRFAQLGNNLFGQWCFTEGCGIVPAKRAEGAKHEVRKFESVDDALIGYMHNLNTGHAYDSLRTIRAFLRWQNRPVEGHTVAGGLGRYSEKGDAYIEEIREVMRVNHSLIFGSNP